MISSPLLTEWIFYLKQNKPADYTIIKKLALLLYIINHHRWNTFSV
ncbi:hypothetical protein [Flavobacterium soli]|nr:hypothetical protein [Flavobacterium soli]